MLHFADGGSLTFEGLGTGSTTHTKDNIIATLVADPSQVQTHS